MREHASDHSRHKQHNFDSLLRLVYWKNERTELVVTVRSDNLAGT